MKDTLLAQPDSKTSLHVMILPLLEWVEQAQSSRKVWHAKPHLNEWEIHQEHGCSSLQWSQCRRRNLPADSVWNLGSTMWTIVKTYSSNTGSIFCYYANQTRFINTIWEAQMQQRKQRAEMNTLLYAGNRKVWYKKTQGKALKVSN